MALQGPDTSALPNQPITFSGSEQQAFQIDGTLVSATVPEPSSVLLAACGLSALIFKRKSGTSNRATIN
jgi:hypothetical protein